MQAVNDRRIPSLDGWRAISIGVVLAAHVFRDLPPGSTLQWLSLITQTAMTIFFVLSGYLITGLLIREADRTGGMDLRRYYVRRFLRIVPPFYAFLLVVAVVGLAPPRGLLASASFTFGYSPWTMGEMLGHTWSLSLEEQFYLLWPMVLAAGGRRAGVRFAIAVIALEPGVRVLQWLYGGALHDHVARLLHTRADALMCGCLAALLAGNPMFEACAARWLRPRWAVACGVFLALGSPAMAMVFRGRYELVFGLSLESLAVTFLVLYSVRHPASGLGRVLNWRPHVHLGIISYGVYVWQQLFCKGPFGPWFRSFPWNVICAIAMGQLSWWTVEAWSRRMRARIGASRRAEPALAATAR